MKQMTMLQEKVDAIQKINPLPLESRVDSKKEMDIGTGSFAELTRDYKDLSGGNLFGYYG